MIGIKIGLARIAETFEMKLVGGFHIRQRGFIGFTLPDNNPF
jgi:hypothetical protein